MSISTHPFMPRPRQLAARVTLAIALLALACTETKDADSGSRGGLRDSGPTTLVIDLPAGVKVGIDGQDPRVPPVAPIQIESGKHTIKLSTACQQMEIEVDAVAHEATRIDRALVSGLEVATMEITTRDLKGAMLEHSVAIGDVVVGGGKGNSRTVLPACEYRVRVASDGLGGFIEDIDLGRTTDVHREVVLAPGPDMIRFYGGEFTLGLPDELVHDPRWLDIEWGRPLVPQIPVEVGMFDFDKSPVTAEQWMACRKAGGCQRRSDDWWATSLPDDRNRSYCNVDTGMRTAVMAKGRENHPMNCVARWQAEDYCLWAEKRLPTADEWEYAARSGKNSYIWPWGNAPDTCDRGHSKNSWDSCDAKKGTAPVCSYPEGDTEQGVCDVVGNVHNYVQWSDAGPIDGNPRGVRCKGSGWHTENYEPMVSRGCPHEVSQVDDVGFRCARTVSVDQRGPR